jgi:hypothetical protein
MRSQTPRGRTLHLVAVVGGFLVCVGLAVALLSVANMNKWRRCVPWSATEVREWRWSDLDAYSYRLKARMTQEEWLAFVKRAGLSPRADPAVLSWGQSELMRRSGADLAWWDPSEGGAVYWCAYRRK